MIEVCTTGAPAARTRLTLASASLIRPIGTSEWPDIGRLLALRASFYVELDPLIFFQGFEAFRLNFGEMRKEIFATLVCSNKSKPLSIVEPFDDTSFHSTNSLEILIDGQRPPPKPHSGVSDCLSVPPLNAW
jgi:hypothetical protein